MVDRERILAKLDELNGYLEELRRIAPSRFEVYQESLEKRDEVVRALKRWTATAEESRRGNGGENAHAEG